MHFGLRIALLRHDSTLGSEATEYNHNNILLKLSGFALAAHILSEEIFPSH